MAVLVIGASSQIGHCLLPRLLAAGFDVVALSRKAQAGTARIEWKLARVPDHMPEPARYDAALAAHAVTS